MGQKVLIFQDGRHLRCSLLKVKKKRQGRSLHIPIDFFGIARGLELAKFLWAAWRMAHVGASGKGNLCFVGSEAMEIVYIDR